MPRSRSVLLAICLTSFALVAAAVYLQHAHDMQPCPLCVIQRYLFIGVGLGALIAALSGRVRLWAGLALLSALGGLAVVGKHLYVLAHPGFSCGIDPMETTLNTIPTAEYLPWLFRADGLCENATDALFGLSIPQWSALWFGALTLSLLWALSRRSR